MSIANRLGGVMLLYRKEYKAYRRYYNKLKKEYKHENYMSYDEYDYVRIKEWNAKLCGMETVITMFMSEQAFKSIEKMIEEEVKNEEKGDTPL